MIDLSPTALGVTNLIREVNGFPNEDRYKTFVKGPIYVGYETPVHYSGYSPIAIPKIDTNSNQIDGNTKNSLTDGSMSRITRNDNTILSSATEKQVNSC